MNYIKNLAFAPVTWQEKNSLRDLFLGSTSPDAMGVQR